MRKDTHAACEAVQAAIRSASLRYADSTILSTEIDLEDQRPVDEIDREIAETFARSWDT